MAESPPPLLERPRLLVESISAATWRWIDVAVAVGLFVGLTVPAALGVPDREGSPAAILLFGAAASLPLAVRRRWPLAVLTAVVAATAVGTAAGVRFTPFGSSAGPAVAIAMYTVAVGSARRVAMRAAAASVVVLWVAVLVADAAHPEQDHNAIQVAVVVAGWMIGEAVRARRAYRTELAERRGAEADERAHRRVAEERLRISREVHDVVSHSLGVIAVQAGVGRLVFEDRPAEARSALVEIEDLSRKALDELRLLLGALRKNQSDGEGLGPAPGLAEVPALVEQMRAAGLEVSLELPDMPARLPPMLELSAYRIVQEALTNVLKHAPGERATVKIRRRDGALELWVENTGPRLRRRQPDVVSGNIAVFFERGPLGTVGLPGWGLTGMRERVAMFGGELIAEPRMGGGFRLIARLPTDPVGAGGRR